MLRQILKPLVVDGTEITPGSIVDVSGWRNAKALEAMRYLAPVPKEAAGKPRQGSQKPAEK